MKRALTLALAIVIVAGLEAVEPNADTRRWWSHVQALANDSMRGRDTGSPEHRKAQEYVVAHLERQGLRPAGEQGWYQAMAFKRMRLQPEQSGAVLTRGGRAQPLRWLQHIVVAPATGLAPTVSGELVFAGSDNGASLDTAGKIVVRLNPVRLVAGPAQPAPPADAAAVIGIDALVGPEPMRWPAQYSVALVPADADFPAARGPMNLRFNPAAADILLEGTGRNYKELVALADAGRPVPSFPLNASLQLSPMFETTTLSSDNVLGVLPGTDPILQREHVVVIAHIDGYGVGEPWGTDGIYNGAFDNAAYVATLLDLAERLRETNTGLRRSLLFAVVTGEEKGLHGSRYFTQHPTVPRDQLVAAINLDQLRPIFPLRTLTMHAIDESTLGDTARAVAGPMNIRLQADPEPLRNLLRRTDHWPFMQIGVPATSFIFGYEPGTPDEVEYRRWYREQYHTPLDDLNQPWVPEAAAAFNQFFERLVIAVANADARPQWKAGSEFAPR
jgi:Zn-dependent M28 family amino/carboxypeptidase